MITIIPLSGGEEKIPFYGTIGNRYLGKFITITSKRNGLFGRKFNQTINGPSSHVSITLPYSFVEIIKRVYTKELLREELLQMDAGEIKPNYP
jgi:hypothetical protein